MKRLLVSALFPTLALSLCVPATADGIDPIIIFEEYGSPLRCTISGDISQAVKAS